MDPVSAVSSSVEAVNKILQFANAATIETAEKLMKLSVETAVGKEPGKGDVVDITA
ncbi:MAG: hypothetical protein N2053_04255 [Chitinispirillaceae bacterium]|nr:hypothetical protein [Chitinispirillaceae bacterium]